jgi:hypothetical protein
LGAADVVLAAGEFVFHAGIADYQAEGVRQREMTEGQRAAVELEGVTGAGVGGDELVHDAAAGAGEVVFGALAGEGELDPVERVAGEGEEGEADAHFERGGGTDAGAVGDVAGEPEIGARQGEAALFQFDGDAADVVAPVALEGGAGLVEVDLELLVLVGGVDSEERRSGREARAVQVANSMATGMTKPSL